MIVSSWGLSPSETPCHGLFSMSNRTGELPHHDAALGRPPVSGPRDDERRASGALFHGRAASIFRGEKLLTTPNPGEDRDSALFAKLGLVPA